MLPFSHYYEAFLDSIGIGNLFYNFTHPISNGEYMEFNAEDLRFLSNHTVGSYLDNAYGLERLTFKANLTCSIPTMDPMHTSDIHIHHLFLTMPCPTLPTLPNQT